MTKKQVVQTLSKISGSAEAVHDTAHADSVRQAAYDVSESIQFWQAQGGAPEQHVMMAFYLVLALMLESVPEYSMD